MTVEYVQLLMQAELMLLGEKSFVLSFIRTYVRHIVISGQSFIVQEHNTANEQTTFTVYWSPIGL